MTVNLSALLSCLTKKTKTNPESVKEDFVCRKRGEGQDKAFNNIVLLIKAHWKKKKKDGTVSHWKCSFIKSKWDLPMLAAVCTATNKTYVWRNCSRVQTMANKAGVSDALSAFQILQKS